MAGWRLTTDLVGVEEGGLPEEALHVARPADALVHRHLPDHLRCDGGGMGVMGGGMREPRFVDGDGDGDRVDSDVLCTEPNDHRPSI